MVKAAVTPGWKTCPGCSETILAHLIACRPCWLHLPRPRREALIGAYTRDALALAFAVKDVVEWLRAHPRRRPA